MDQQGHIIVTGTGASGTTFLMDVFAEMGLDTHYQAGHASFEFHDQCACPLPKIIKRPQFCEDLDCWLNAGLIVDHAVVLVRSLEDAAESRRLVYQRDGQGADGSLFGTTCPEEQTKALARLLGQLLSTLANRKVRHSFLDYEAIKSNDTDYLFHRLKAIFADSGMVFDESSFRDSYPKASARRISRSKPQNENGQGMGS